MFAWRRHILIMVLFLFICFRAGADHTLTVLPFEDGSGFNGHWNLSTGIASLLAKRLDQVRGYRVTAADSSTETAFEESLENGGEMVIDSALVTFDSLRIGYLIRGKIEEFGISRFGIATPTVGGYQSYRAGVRVRFSLWERGIGTALLTDESEAEIKQRGLGLTLFGKPTDQMQEYEMLDQLEFGSETFMATIIGQAVDTLLTNIIEKIQAALPPQKNLESAIGPAVIVSINEGQIYINRGHEDGIKVEDRFEVYRRGRELHDPETGELLGYSDHSVGAIRVILVKSAHLSVAEIVEGELQEGDEVR